MISEDDARDELLINGMFRNRDYKGLPISGSDVEYFGFEHDEIILHNQNLLAAIEEDQMSTIREWYGKECIEYV